MIDLKTPKGHFEINYLTFSHSILPNNNNMYCIFAKHIVLPYWKVLQIWVGKQKNVDYLTFLPSVHEKNWVSTSGNWITLRNLDFFYSPRLKAPKKIKRTMFFWYKQFWTKPWKKMDWSTSFFCNLSSKQQITPNLILGKEVYKALNCVPTYVKETPPGGQEIHSGSMFDNFLI